MAIPPIRDAISFQLFRHRVRAHPLLGAAIIFLLLLVLLLWGAHLYQDSLMGQDRVIIDQPLTIYRDSLESSLNIQIQLVQNITATIEGNVEAGRDENDTDYLQKVVTFNPGIRDISIAPGGIVTYRYPAEPDGVLRSEDLIHDTDPVVRAAVQRAMTSNDVVVESPHPRADGGYDLVIREAIWNESAFWGLLTITLDLPPILRESLGPENASDLSLAIRDSSGQVFYGDPATFDQSPVIRRINVHDGFWDFAAVPPGGWAAAASDRMTVYWAAGLAIIFTMTCLVFIVISSHSLLSRAVKERTLDLEREKMTLKKLNRALEVISKCNSDLVRAKTEEELLWQVCDTLVTSGNYPLAWVGIPSNGEQHAELTPVAVARSPGIGGPDIFSSERAHSKEQYIAEQAVALASPQVVKYASLEPDDPGIHPKCELCPDCRSMIALPISTIDSSPLALVIYSPRDDAFDRDEVALLLQLSDDLAFGIQSLRTQTARKAAEKELLIKGYALNSSVSGITMADLDGRIIYANDAYRRMFGYHDAAALVGKSIDIFSQQDEHEKNMPSTILEAVENDGFWMGEVRPRRYDGTRFEANLLMSMVKDEEGKPICTMASFLDITGQKEQEKQMVIRNNAIASSINPILFFDLTGKVTFANRAFLSTWGYDRHEQVAGRHYDEFFTGGNRSLKGNPSSNQLRAG
jgi:PAS domain S-box